MLHVYHHISVPMVGWMSNWVSIVMSHFSGVTKLRPSPFPLPQISPTMPVLGLFAMLISFCHILMYTYYAMASFGPSVQPYLWWKKYLTQIQLIQFAIIGLYGLFLNLLHTGYPFIYRMMPVSQAIIYLILFGHFYWRSYGFNSKKKEPKED